MCLHLLQISLHGIFSFMQSNGTAPPPHMIVVPLAQYDQSIKKFKTPKTCSKDNLLPKGHQYCRAEEYHLGKYVYMSLIHTCMYGYHFSGIYMYKHFYWYQHVGHVYTSIFAVT